MGKYEGVPIPVYVGVEGRVQEEKPAKEIIDGEFIQHYCLKPPTGPAPTPPAPTPPGEFDWRTLNVGDVVVVPKGTEYCLVKAAATSSSATTSSSASTGPSTGPAVNIGRILADPFTGEVFNWGEGGEARGLTEARSIDWVAAGCQVGRRLTEVQDLSKSSQTVKMEIEEEGEIIG